MPAQTLNEKRAEGEGLGGELIPEPGSLSYYSPEILEIIEKNTVSIHTV